MVVVGGGIIGRSIAFELARRGGMRVTLIDHGGLGGEASPAAAGVLPVASSRAPRGIVLEMGRQSLAAYPSFLEEVAAASGIAVRLNRSGLILLARSEVEMKALQERAVLRRADGFAAEAIDEISLRRAIPDLADSFVGAWSFADVAQVDAVPLLNALGVGAERRGVKLIRGAAVTGLDVGQSRVTGIRLGADRIAAGWVVIAAGWWSAALAATLGVELPLQPARGEILSLPLPSRLPTQIVAHGETQIIPHGRTAWVGATVELDSTPHPTPAGRRALLEGAGRIAPRFLGARVAAHWAGVRPASSIRRPIIDRLPGCENVIVATGHHRSGFLLAPVSARHTAALLRGEIPPLPPDSLRWRLPRARRPRGE